MSKFVPAVLAVVVCVAVSGAAFGSARSESKEKVSESAKPTKTVKAAPAVRLSSHEARLVSAVNEYREKHGLEPLKIDPILMHEARQAAPHFSHVIIGKWCWHRCKQRGFRGWATDDIANGYSSPEDAVQGWATSDGHARQMRGYFKMNGRWQNYDFDRIGVGISGRKYIAIFGRQGIRM
jgi:uncharacterized protein YkwD